MRRGWAICLIGLLAALFGATAMLVQWNTAATSDEPLHLVAAYTIRFAGDYRLNPEDPCLWERWVGLGLSKSDISPDYGSPGFREVLGDTMAHWPFVVSTLYRTAGKGGADGKYVPVEPMIRRGRGMMAMVGCVLVAVVAAWAWKMGGKWAGVIGALLVATDPNLLGHAALIKNDIAMSVCFVAAAWATWLIGRRMMAGRMALGRIVMLGVVIGVGLMVKFSGVLLPVAAGMALLCVALIRKREGAGWAVVARFTQAGWVVLSMVLVAAVGVGVMWAAHGFRFTAVPGVDHAMSFSLEQDIKRAKINMAYKMDPQSEYGYVAKVMRDPAIFRFARWGVANRVLPEAWLNGLAYTYFSSTLRDAYFLGHTYKDGDPMYFWGAALFKTPLGTIFLGVVAGVIAWRLGLWRSWGFVVLACFAGLYGVMAMRGALNLGLRHVFPVYGLAYVGTAVCLARGMAAAGPKARRVLMTVCCIGLGGTLLETAAAWPNYIGFFNAPARVAGPLNLLSDSNIDWGQSLPLLAEWRKAHPAGDLYVAYFGTPPPEYYGLDYRPLAGTMLSSRPKSRGGPGIWAVSAPLLQGLYAPEEAQPAYQLLRKRKPLAVLGGGIYLYEVGGVKAGDGAAEGMGAATRP